VKLSRAVKNNVQCFMTAVFKDCHRNLTVLLITIENTGCCFNVFFSKTKASMY